MAIRYKNRGGSTSVSGRIRSPHISNENLYFTRMNNYIGSKRNKNNKLNNLTINKNSQHVVGSIAKLKAASVPIA